MPGKREYGLLAGIGAGLADVGKMGFAAELQRMRDERLAKIEAQAADKRWGRDKELAEMKIGASKEAADLKYERDVDVANIGAKAKAAERNKWELKTIKSTDAGGLETERVMFVNEGTGQQIDTSTPFGGVVKRLADQGVDIGSAVSAAASRFNRTDTGSDASATPAPGDGLSLPERNQGNAESSPPSYIPGSQGPEPTAFQRDVAEDGYLWEQLRGSMRDKSKRTGLLKGGLPSGVF